MLDGITKASASTRIANVTILSSAIAVARAHFSGAAPSTGARIRADYREALDWPKLIEQGYVKTLRLDNSAVQQAFLKTDAARDDPEAAAAPKDLFTEVTFTLADIPSIGIALFGEEGYRKLMARLGPGDHAVALFSNGRWLFTGGDFIRGNQPTRVKVEQSGFAFDARDTPISLDLMPTVPHAEEFALLKIPGSAGLDPSAPWSVSLAVSRPHGLIFPEVITRNFSESISLPAKFFERPEQRNRNDWIGAWMSQWRQLSLLVALLSALTLGLVFQRRLSANKRAFAIARLGFLAITLVWIGWIAQGQLSVVTLLGLVKAVFHGSDLGFLLYDPFSLILWFFTCVCLVIWGRGSFCGWLCPFGALQEFVALAARLLRLPRWRVTPRAARLGVWVKYGVLAVLVAGTAWNMAFAEVLAEAEPFKTAITLGFHREGPLLFYALGLLVWGSFVFKPFCRFLCPLGAGLALAGRARRWNWIPRRSECGSPCRLCEKRCEYGAIDAKGEIDYAECFQCLDCVAIFHDRKACVPLVLADRRQRTSS